LTAMLMSIPISTASVSHRRSVRIMLKLMRTETRRFELPKVEWYLALVIPLALMHYNVVLISQSFLESSTIFKV
jgi:hypothetical protein